MTNYLWKSLLTLLVLLTTVMVLSPAQSQFCSTTCSRYDQGQCVQYTKMCQDQSGPAASFGAIAYGRQSGAYGYSYRMNSQQRAESSAMRRCAEHGSDCEIMAWYDRQCGAVVARTDTTDAYWGTGVNEQQARATAMKECTKDRGKTCTVKVSQCSK